MEDYIYELTNEDVTNAGASMGTPTDIRWRIPFKKLSGAKKFAEGEFGKKIEWKHELGDRWISPDFGYVMYTIKRVKLN